jgi:glycerophosphoryl diester phosphodiesterase
VVSIVTVFQNVPVFILHRVEAKEQRSHGWTAYSQAFDVTDWIEFDVRRSSDGVLIVFHDEKLSTGERAGSLPYDRLRQLGVRSLDDFLSGLPARINVVLDVKNSIDDATCAERLTTAWLAAYAAGKVARDRSVLLTSFDPSIIARARQYEHAVRVGLTTWQGVPLRESIPTATAFQASVLAAHIDALMPNGIELGDSKEALAGQVAVAHSAKLQLACWGAQDLTCADLEYLADLGVDAIYVDEQNLGLLQRPGEVNRDSD